MSLEEQTVFMRTTRSSSNIMICPALLGYARAEVERDAKLSKALRLAKEEREEQRKQGRPKGGRKGGAEET